MPIRTTKPMCWWCKHLIITQTKTGFRYSCSAFETIPDPILEGNFDHREPYPGDNGIRFEISSFEELMQRRFFSRSADPKGLVELIYDMLRKFDNYRTRGLMKPPIQKPSDNEDR